MKSIRLRYIPLTFFCLTLFSNQAFAQWVRFGRPGAQGEKGVAGKQGRHGRNIILKADGKEKYLQLRGLDGDPGRDGSDGPDADNCWQRRDQWNMIGAPGGQGGEGGYAGGGGNGGNSTIYFQSEEQLSSLTINAEGGRGSYGGRSGEGGRPCFCTYRHWRFRYKDKNGRVFYRDFHCREGERGRRGRSGEASEDGKRGKVSLIKGIKSLKPEYPSQRVSAQDFEKEIILSKNIWINKRGILDFINPNSIVSDQYRFFKKRLEQRIRFSWESRRSAEQSLGDAKISVHLESDLSYKFPEGFWVKSQEELTREGTKVVRISHLVSPKHLKSIRPQEIELDGTNTTLIIKDSVGLNQFIKTDFFITTNWRLKDDFWQTFKGKIPKTLIEKKAGSFHIHLGQLPVKAKTFKKRAIFHLIIKRHFEQYQTEIRSIKVTKHKGRPLTIE
jgi:hypothetical protein